MSKGRSGIKMMFAPPASPECSAIQPAWRPMTSTMMTRWCDSAVVCRRSIASVAMLTAVSNPKVKSVPERSLSMVFGTPTTWTPRSDSLVATPRVSSPPMATSASQPWAARLLVICSTPPSTPNGLVRDDPRMVPPRGRMRRTWSTPNTMVSFSSGPRHPSRKPTNSCPNSLVPLRTTARITAFKPGQSPPPVKTPTRIKVTLAARSDQLFGDLLPDLVGLDLRLLLGTRPFAVPRELLRVLRVEVDVFLAGQPHDLVHDLVGDGAQDVAIVLHTLVAAEVQWR